MDSHPTQVRRLGPYTLLRELGAGGMGTVWLAEEDGEKVALKAMHPHLVNRTGYYQRFQREAEAGARVEHRNVVRTLGSELLMQGGTPWCLLTMEYVEGRTLRAFLNDLGTVPEGLLRAIAQQVAAGLAAIHAEALVHRDIKPDNVLITPDHVVRIMDLGVAKDLADSLLLTQEGHFAGSVFYVAPEQVAGGPLDGRVDLYALGVTLYELACGRHPYADKDPAAVIQRWQAIRPRRLGEVNPQTSPFFEEVVHCLMQHAPADRFSSARELARVLEAGEDSLWWQERARRIRERTQRPLRRMRIPRETAVYGRDEELTRLRTAFERAKAGAGCTLLVEGEAGIGKSRLVDAFVDGLRDAGEPMHFLYGDYPPGGAATGAGAFSTAFREQFGDEELEETLPRYLHVAPLLVPAFIALLRGEPPPPGAEPLTQESLQAVFVHALRALAAEKPVVVLIDDLHFAPEEGRALFTALALAAPAHPVLLVGTARPGLPERWLADLAHIEDAGRMPLSRLGPKDLVALLADAFGARQPAEELAGRIGAKSDGNPFFVFEIVRGLREKRLIRQHPDGSWGTSEVIEDIEVPASVLELVNARVAALSDPERNLLDVASCMGYEFDALLAAAALELERIAALQLLAGIEKRHRLIRAAGRRFVFDHHQVQEALYGALPPLLRESYHAALGDALERSVQAQAKEPGDLGGAVCVELCEQFLAGGQGERTLRYLHPALDHLGAGYLNDQIVALSDKALTMAGLLEGERRCEARLRQSAALDLLARRTAQEEALAEARALAEELARDDLRVRVESASASLYERTGRYAEAEACVGRWRKLAERLQDRGEMGRALVGFGVTDMGRGHFADGYRRAKEALAFLQTLDDPKQEARALAGLGIACDGLGRHEEALGWHEQQLELSRKSGDRLAEHSGYGNLGLVLMHLGRTEEALAHFQQKLEAAREIGDRHGEGRALGMIGSALASLGRTAEAIETLETHLRVAYETGDMRGVSSALGSLGQVHLDTGQYGRAHRLLEEQYWRAEELGDLEGQAGAALNSGHALRRLGREEEGRERYASALRLFRELGSRRGESVVETALGNACSTQGRHEEARAHYARALDLARGIGYRQGEGTALAALGSNCLANGRLQDALEHQEAARAVFAETGRRLFEATGLGNLAMTFSLLGNWTEALLCARTSEAIAREVGALHLLSLCHVVRASAAEQEGDAEQAARAGREAVALSRESDGEQSLADVLLAWGRLARRLGHDDEARAALDECARMGAEHDWPHVRVLAACERSPLDPEILPAASEAYGLHSEHLAPRQRMEAAFLLWQARPERTFLLEAKRALDDLITHAPAEWRGRMATDVGLHREILAAWREANRSPR